MVNKNFTENILLKELKLNKMNYTKEQIRIGAEKAFILDLIVNKFPKGIVSYVADSFNLWDVVTKILPTIKSEIMARDGKLVIRPDSGNPVDIMCGTNIKSYDTLEKAKIYFKDKLHDNQIHGEAEFEIDTETIVKVGENLFKLVADVDWNRYDKQYYFIESITIEAKELEWKPSDKGVVELLWDTFGGKVNEQGYKVLDSHIGAIYGDSINLERQIQIYQRLADKGFAATNIVLGVGSFTYVMLTRDSAGFAAKGSWFEVEEIDQEETKKVEKERQSIGAPLGYAKEYKTTSYNIFKDPITDDGQKRSLKGLLRVDKDPITSEYFVQTECTPAQEKVGLLQTIYEDGQFFNQTTLTEIRSRILNGNV